MSDPRVVRLVFTGNGWGLPTNGDGFPPVVGTYAHMSQLTFDAATGANFLPGPLLGMTVNRTGNASGNILYVAFEVMVNGVRQLEVAATNTANLTAWSRPSSCRCPRVRRR